MIRNTAFKNFTDDYQAWFDKNKLVYEAELDAFKSLEIQGLSVEIGSGTGKFTKPLGITLGVEPTKEMFSRSEGFPVLQGIAEDLPLLSDTFDWVVMVTTICFVTDPVKACEEMLRILKPGGKCAIGFVDAESELGKQYQKKKKKSLFYKEATFYTTEEIISVLKRTGFKNMNARQTLMPTSEGVDFSTVPGAGDGGFVIISAKK